MKNKNTIIIIAIVIILLIGGGLFLSMNKTAPQGNAPQIPDRGNPPAATTSLNVNQNNNNSIEQIEGTIKSLLTSGKSISCTFSNNDKDVNISGTVYASGGKIREDFQSSASENKMSGHVIVQPPDAYMWTDQFKQGFKFSIEGQPTPPAGQNNQTPDINKTMRFTCQPWTADSSVFNLPSDITFQTMSIPAGAAGGSASGSSNGSSTGTTNLTNQCAVCDNIPAGAARDACKAQLKCP